MPLLVQAGGVPGELDEVVVTGYKIGGLAGAVTSATEGTVLGEQLETRPVLRTGEVLEVVPGLVVTQHSGDGKANQYFLRGFNLDHGTDFASRVEGMPVNMPTHAHGQGYSDINFMIPELVDRIEYRKGTYYAEEGNFSAAGAVDVTYQRALDRPLLTLGGGENRFGRVLAAASPELGNGNLLMAVDADYNNGPWDLDEHFRKFNGVLKYSGGDPTAGYDVEAMGYQGHWRSTDQIPLRAVDDGSIDRFGNIDPTDGGSTHRYSLSAAGWGRLGEGTLRASAYAIDYRLNLFSNFTYDTDPVHGDQFEQYDRRQVYGADTNWRRELSMFGLPGHFGTGLQARVDDISPVGLYHTVERQRYGTVRQDDVTQASWAGWMSQDLQWTDWLRTELGLRFDSFHFKVDSDLAANSGTANDHITSPKVSVVLGPWDQNEFFVNWGRGYHSNDARGTTITVDPADGVTPADKVTPLVRATGREIGVRSATLPQLQLSASLWQLDIASELLFTGDGGSTEASRPSRRTGVELSAYYTPAEHWIVDTDVAFARPRFTDDDPVGNRIPNAVERVISLGVSYRDAHGFFGGARLRHLGPAALIEGDTVRSKPTTLVNLDVGYHITRNLSAAVTVLNLFDEKANDITYYYESQLPGEAAPVGDIHFHPVEPRELRFALTAKF
ncbi:MAG: TonB-dependent receptor [Pseudomonadota bacterium]